MKIDVHVLRHDDGRWAAAIWQPQADSCFVHLWAAPSKFEAEEIADYLRFAAECQVSSTVSLVHIVGTPPSEMVDGSDPDAWTNFAWRTPRETEE